MAGLHALAIQVEPQAQALRIGHLVARDQPGADGAKGVAALALVPGAPALDLEFTLADVVDHAVASHVRQCVLLRHVARGAADDDAEFDLPIALLRTLGQHHVVVRPLNARDGLGEDDRLLRDGHARLGRVVGVVETDGDELADARHRAAQARAAAHQRQRRWLQAAQTGQRGIAQLRRADVGHDGGQVAQLAGIVQQGRPFLAGWAAAQQLHGNLLEPKIQIKTGLRRLTGKRQKLYIL